MIFLPQLWIVSSQLELSDHSSQLSVSLLIVLQWILYGETPIWLYDGCPESAGGKVKLESDNDIGQHVSISRQLMTM